MMGHHARSEALFYYFRQEDEVPENHLLRLMDKHVSFEIAPASLVFRDVRALKIQLDWSERIMSWGQAISINGLERTRIEDVGGKPFYSWRFLLHDPPGDISFDAAGFTQTLLATPVESGNTSLTLRQRSRALGAA